MRLSSRSSRLRRRRRYPRLSHRYHPSHPPAPPAPLGRDVSPGRWALPDSPDAQSSPQVVRFFDRKEYYSVHGAAADFVARTFYRTTSVVKTLARPRPPDPPRPASRRRRRPLRPRAPACPQGSGENALPGVTLNRVLFETVVRQLLLEARGHGTRTPPPLRRLCP